LSNLESCRWVSGSLRHRSRCVAHIAHIRLNVRPQSMKFFAFPDEAREDRRKMRCLRRSSQIHIGTAHRAAFRVVLAMASLRRVQPRRMYGEELHCSCKDERCLLCSRLRTLLLQSFPKCAFVLDRRMAMNPRQSQSYDQLSLQFVLGAERMTSAAFQCLSLSQYYEL
jgi:hypothetical protein